MAKNLDDIFNECYERIRFGESLESVLRSYPQYRSQLEPLLRTTFDIGRRASYIQPRPEFRHWARVRFESAMQYPQHPPQQRQPARAEAPAASMWLRHGWAVIVSVGLMVLLGTGSTMAASSGAMPNEPLYPVKLVTEDVQRAFAVSPDRKAEFETDVANIRAAELQAMADAGNAEQAAKAAQRYDDQFERAIQAILSAEGTEPLAIAPVPPAQTTPAVTAPPVTTPTVTAPTPVAPTPAATPTPGGPTPEATVTDNGTSENTGTENTTQSGTTTPPAVTVPSENTTPPATSTVTPDTGEQPPTATEEQPPTTDNQPGVTEEQPSTTEGASTTEGQPATSTPAVSTQSSKAKELRDKLNRQKSTVQQSLKDAREKASHQDKSDWQDTIDKVSKKTATKATSEQSDSHNQTTIQTDNNTTPSTNSGKNKPSSSNQRR